MREALRVESDGLVFELPASAARRSLIEGSAGTPAGVSGGRWSPDPFADLSPAVVVTVGALALACERRRRAG